MFLQFEFYQIQTPQPIDNTFRLCSLDVCLITLHVGNFFIFTLITTWEEIKLDMALTHNFCLGK